MLVRKDRKRESAHQDEADGPSHIQIELAPRHELETQVAVDQPRGGFASHHHRDRVDNGHRDGHAEIGVDDGETGRYARSGGHACRGRVS